MSVVMIDRTGPQPRRQAYFRLRCHVCHHVIGLAVRQLDHFRNRLDGQRTWHQSDSAHPSEPFLFARRADLPVDAHRGAHIPLRSAYADDRWHAALFTRVVTLQ